jgi:ADP-ribose pyrophosphatase YjhB (NUDIX family)
MKNEKLSREEELQLISLLKRTKMPVSYDLFLAIMSSFPSIPVELAVFNKEGEILLFNRIDDEFDGYHSPGTVLRNDDTVEVALKRLIEGELKGLRLTEPISLGWHENIKGSGYFQNPTRHEISLIHVCEAIRKYNGEGEFFSLDKLPKNMVPHHRKLVPEIARRFKEYKKVNKIKSSLL